MPEGSHRAMQRQGTCGRRKPDPLLHGQVMGRQSMGSAQEQCHGGFPHWGQATGSSWENTQPVREAW